MFSNGILNLYYLYISYTYTRACTNSQRFHVSIVTSQLSRIVVLSEISIRIMNSFSARFDRQRKLVFLTCSEFGRRNILSRGQFFLSLISMLHPGCVLSSEMVIDCEIHKNAFIFSAQERVFSVFALLHFLRFQNSDLCVRELQKTHRKVKNLLFNM